MEIDLVNQIEAICRLKYVICILWCVTVRLSLYGVLFCSSDQFEAESIEKSLKLEHEMKLELDKAKERDLKYRQ